MYVKKKVKKNKNSLNKVLKFNALTTKQKLAIVLNLNHGQIALSHNDNTSYRTNENHFRFRFLPRCMKCRRGLAMRILSVCLSVRLSVTRVHCDKTVERSVQICTPYKRTFIPLF